MMIPTVHMNGTGKESLLKEVRAAYEALDAAKTALMQMTVHGRDYYVQSAGAYEVARGEHFHRIDAIVAMQEQLMEYYQAIDKQGR